MSATFKPGTHSPAPHTEEQDRIRLLAENLLHTLDAVVPSSTIHYAVEDARRALRQLIKTTDTIHTAEPTTWTFFGHWEGSRIIVEYSLPGEVHDDRRDTGEWPEGLWAASGSGVSVEQAQEDAVAEYEDDDEDDDPEDDDEEDEGEIPEDFEVKVLVTEAEKGSAQLLMTCGTCGRSWDDAVGTSVTPTPSGRCPFEYYH